MFIVHYGDNDCLHFKQEIDKAERDIKLHKKLGLLSRITGSEHYILRLLKAVRNGELRADDLKLFCKDVKIDVDVKGEFIQPWPDDLFEAAFYLRFDKIKPTDLEHNQVEALPGTARSITD